MFSAKFSDDRDCYLIRDNSTYWYQTLGSHKEGHNFMIRGGQHGLTPDTKSRHISSAYHNTFHDVYSITIWYLYKSARDHRDQNSKLSGFYNRVEPDLRKGARATENFAELLLPPSYGKNNTKVKNSKNANNRDVLPRSAKVGHQYFDLEVERSIYKRHYTKMQGPGQERTNYGKLSKTQLRNL